MKTFYKLLVLLLLSIWALAFPANALAAGPKANGKPDEVVFGGDFTVKSGDTLDEGLVVFGGSVVIERGATITGDVAVMGGNLQGDGLVEGNVLVMGGNVALGDTAVIEGDVIHLGGTFERAPEAQIQGDVVAELPKGADFPLKGPWIFPFFGKGSIDNLDTGYIPPIWDGLWFLWVPFAMLTMAALSMMIVMFWPRPIERIAKAAVTQPLISGGMGLLTFIVLPFAIIIMVVLCVTIVAIPVVIVVLGLATLLGWTAIGLELGKRVASALKQDWHPALAAGVGVLLLTLVAAGIEQASQVMPWLCCIGWAIPTVIAAVALGAALLTRFGTVEYPLPGAVVIEAPVTPAPEAEPVVTEPLIVEPDELPAPKRPARKAKPPKTE